MDRMQGIERFYYDVEDLFLAISSLEYRMRRIMAQTIDVADSSPEQGWVEFFADAATLLEQGQCASAANGLYTLLDQLRIELKLPEHYLPRRVWVEVKS